MNTKRTTTQRLDEEISNAGVPSQVIQVPSLEQVANDDQDSVNPPLLMDGDRRETFLEISQDITTQEQAMTTQYH